MKYIKFISTAIFLIIIFFLYRSYIAHNFEGGDCVEDSSDGYVWQIHNYHLGKYRAAGWQDRAWGNSVELGKDILERRDIGGTPVYTKVSCPEYIP